MKGSWGVIGGTRVSDLRLCLHSPALPLECVPASFLRSREARSSWALGCSVMPGRARAEHETPPNKSRVLRGFEWPHLGARPPSPLTPQARGPAEGHGGSQNVCAAAAYTAATATLCKTCCQRRPAAPEGSGCVHVCARVYYKPRGEKPSNAYLIFGNL